MSKGLEALERIKNALFNRNEETQIIKDIDFVIIEKELKGYERMLKVFGLKELANTERKLKALVILKDILQLKVYKNKLGQCFLEGTNVLIAIDHETYDLLKEVLL